MRRALILIILGVSYSLNAQPKSNLTVISNLLDQAKTEIITNREGTLKAVKIESEYPPLSQKLSDIFKTDSIETNNESYNLLLRIDSLTILYNADEEVKRNIALHYTIYKNSGNAITETSSGQSYQDTISKVDIAAIENPDFPFTEGRLIESDSLWDDIVEPAVYVGAAAAALYLLFTVRSG